MKSLRILVGADVPPDPNSGAAGTVYHTSAALRELGHEVDEIWTDDLPRHIRHGNLHYLLELPRCYRNAVRSKVAEKNYDVIQLSQPHAWLAAREHRQLRRHGIFVIRSHGLEQRVDEDVRRYGRPDAGKRWPKRLVSKGVSRLLRRHQSLAVRYADLMIVPCHDDRDYLVNEMSADPRRVSVIRHGATQHFIDEPLRPFSKARWKKMLYVGQFAYIKGPHVLARVAQSVLRAHSDVSLTWVCGQSHHQSVRALLDPTIASRVQLEDWRPQDKLMDLYDEHGIFLFPSLAEGAGKASVEAMTRGMVVIATRTSGMREAIDHNRSGLLCDAGNAESFARATSRALGDLDLCQSLAIAARESSIAYTWKRCAEHAVDFYHTLLHRRSFDEVE